MDSAGVIPEISSTLPPVPHFTFSVISSPGGLNSSTGANVAITNGHPSARKHLKPLIAVENHSVGSGGISSLNNNPNKRNNPKNNLYNSTAKKML